MTLPLPPAELRRTVGPLDDSHYDNPGRDPVFAREEPRIDYDAVFDFGCGCGRLARQMMQQVAAPRRYLGVDLHRPSIEWCQQNLGSVDERFEFQHVDIYNLSFNPSGRREPAALPGEDGAFSLVLAHSVFTHILEGHLAHYLGQCARLLSRDGIFRSTWFLFDKALFPVMQEFQNALYINTDDPTNAVYYDAAWMQARFVEAGLSITRVIPPPIRGFQWTVFARLRRGDEGHVAMPEDRAPIGINRPPV